MPQAAPSSGQALSRLVHAGRPHRAWFRPIGSTGSVAVNPHLNPNLNPYPSPNQVYWLRWLPPKKSELLYHLAMTGSNVVAVACVGVWVVHAQAHLATRFFAAAAIAVLVFLRQKESNEHCRVSRWVSVMVRVKGPTSAAASVGGASSFSGAAPF